MMNMDPNMLLGGLSETRNNLNIQDVTDGLRPSERSDRDEFDGEKQYNTKK
jgi:hypothetical protein